MIESEAQPVFPNYTEMQPRVPAAVWPALRAISVIIALVGVSLLLFIAPQAGLFLFWGLFIPLAPLIFFVAPGFWRNICPMAALNQTPRLFGFSRGLTLPSWLKEYNYMIGISLLLLIIPTCKVLFNPNGPMTALLVLGALMLAFIGGLIFKGKSGWCSSICPLLPVQRLYGQTPFLIARNSYCQPCVGCAKNCYDFNPTVAYLADQYDEDRHYRNYRKFFAGAFPGLILAFYTVPNPPTITVLDLYLQFGLYILVSVGSFFALDSLLKLTPIKLPSAPLQVGSRQTLAAHLDSQEGRPEVTFMPDKKRVVVEPGRTLLETVESAGLLIEAGCRMGVCGADPVAILAGMENLSPIGREERTTLERLGLGEVAAINSIGGDAVYQGFVPVTMLKVVGIDLTSVGRFEPASEDEIVIVLEDMVTGSEERHYRKLMIADGKIAGAILIGYPVDAPVVVEVVKQQVEVTPYLDALRAGDWSMLHHISH